MGSAARLGTALAVAVAALAGPLAGVAAAAGAPALVPAPVPSGPVPSGPELSNPVPLDPWPLEPERPAPVPLDPEPLDPQSVDPQPLAGAPGAEQPGGGPSSGWRVFVEVSPGTVQPGYLVGIRASCRDNSVPAIVVSDAFGRVAVRPYEGLLIASPMVRERVWPGNYPVKLECRDGETAATMLQVVKKVPSPSPTRKPTHQPAPHQPRPTIQHPSRGPNTGFGGTAGSGTDGLLLPGGVALAVAGVTIGLATRRRPRAGSRR
ncbi:hypothetical protein [Micromonospora rubida]|uniref:hypothetical protein n=1 Tax=Micromonospora rubida TaxID=2697657 RepID=UPI00137662D2|nr:hypothetical protein [Micromonospora rubida]NBE84237.1 hypothetical protein [Micromonospora rubida]